MSVCSHIYLRPKVKSIDYKTGLHWDKLINVTYFFDFNKVKSDNAVLLAAFSEERRPAVIRQLI